MEAKYSPRSMHAVELNVQLEFAGAETTKSEETSVSVSVENQSKGLEGLPGSFVYTPKNMDASKGAVGAIVESQYRYTINFTL